VTRDELKAWLDRPCPPGSWRDFYEPEPLEPPEVLALPDERPWEEFELLRAAA
jgi:hypothetical protein